MPIISQPNLEAASPAPLSTTLESALDNFVLYSFTKLCKESAESGHTDHEVAVIFRVFLRVSQLLGIQHIELNVIAAIREQGSDDVQHGIPALAALELIGRELHVHVTLKPI